MTKHTLIQYGGYVLASCFQIQKFDLKNTQLNPDSNITIQRHIYAIVVLSVCLISNEIFIIFQKDDPVDWINMVKKGMAKDFSWDVESSGRYSDAYWSIHELQKSILILKIGLYLISYSVLPPQSQ